MPTLHRQLHISDHPQIQVKFTDLRNAGSAVWEVNNVTNMNEADEEMISQKVFATLFNCGCSINSIRLMKSNGSARNDSRRGREVKRTQRIGC